MLLLSQRFAQRQCPAWQLGFSPAKTQASLQSLAQASRRAHISRLWRVFGKSNGLEWPAYDLRTQRDSLMSLHRVTPSHLNLLKASNRRFAEQTLSSQQPLLKIRY